MHLGVHYLYIHNNIYEYRKPKMIYNSEKEEVDFILTVHTILGDMLQLIQNKASFFRPSAPVTVKCPWRKGIKESVLQWATPNATGKWRRPPPPPDLARWSVSTRLRQAHHVTPHNLALGVGMEGK
jgi:hypothetical protein